MKEGIRFAKKGAAQNQGVKRKQLYWAIALLVLWGILYFLVK
jgi:hypothetical protein